MKPDQVWQAVLGELQLQMTKSTYDTWLRDTRLLEYARDPGSGVVTYIVGTQSTYTQDWLRNKLYPTIKRTIAGIVGETVVVRFELEESEDGADDQDLPANAEPEAPEPPGWTKLRAAIEQEAPARTTAPAAVPPETKRTVLVRQSHRTAYEAIVKPAQIVRIPTVFLTRWVRLLGPRRAWLVTAFWQFAYLSGLYHHKQGARKKLHHQEKAWLQVSGKALARFAGLSPSTFWEYIGDPGYLSWFIRDENRGQYHIGADGRPKQDVNKYDVWLTPPLTPADQAHLREWLLTHAPTQDLDGLLAALDGAVAEPSGHVLAPNPGAAAPNDTEPLTIAEIALQAVPGARVATRVEREAFANLCDDLYVHLYDPENAYLKVTHYFINNWLPRIKHGAAWIVIYLRSLCSADHAQGVIDEEPWVDKGLDALATLVGAGETRKVRRWMQKSSRKRGDEWTLSELAEIIASRKRSDQSVDMQFRVPVLREVLIPADRERRAALLAEYELAGTEDENGVLANSGLIGEEGDGQSRTHRYDGSVPESDLAPGQTRFEDRMGDNQNQTHSDRGIGSHSKRLMTKSGLIERRARDQYRTHREGGLGPNSAWVPANSRVGTRGGRSQVRAGSTPKPERLRDLKVVVEEGETENAWDVQALLNAGEIYGDLRDRVLAADAPGAAYVAWFLLGIRRKRRGRSQKGIDNPAAFAAVQLTKGKHTCDDERLNELAALGPMGVASCLYWQSHRDGYHLSVEWAPARRWVELIGDRVSPGDLGLERIYQQVKAAIEGESG